MTKEEELEISLSKTIDYYEKHISALNRQNVMLYACACNSEEHTKRLKDQLALTEKALELACNDIYWLCAFSGKFTKEEFISRKIDYFKTKAKEIMKSE